MTKACTKCGETKPLADFYTGTRKCKSCTCADVRANRERKVEYYRAYDRVRFYENGARGEASPEAKKKGGQAWRGRNREKRSAHVAVGSAMALGKITRPGSCSACSETRFVEAHHDDYSKPLDVRWLCIPCHAAHHRKHDEAEDRRLLEETRAKRTGSHG